jgi:hypothetical protein
MKDNKHLFDIKDRAIAVAKDLEIFEFLKWICLQDDFGLSRTIKVDRQAAKSKRADRSRPKHMAFEFKGTRYELTLEKERSGPECFLFGDLVLAADGEIVLKTAYTRRTSMAYQCCITELGSNVEILRLGDWVDNFLNLVKVEQAAVARLERKKEQQVAEEIGRNFELGKFASRKRGT